MNRGMLLVTSFLLAGVFGGAARGELRNWTDRTGQHTVEAEFVKGDQQSVTLRRQGKEITIQLAQLSAADQQFVRESLTAAKPADTESTAAVAGESKGADEASDPTSDWRTLIDPSSFDKWTTVGAPGVFKLLPDATIRGAGGRAYLVSPQTYADFELIGRMKVSARGNGGVFFGVPNGTNLDNPRGYEVQLYVRTPGDNNGTGSIWRNGQLTLPLAGRFEVPDRWYSFYIRCQGSSILIKIDDQTVFEKADVKYESGHIALQCYQAGGEVQYADMKIRELSHSQATAATLAGGNGEKAGATEAFAVFDIRLGMTDREVAEVLLRKGIRPSDVTVDETEGGFFKQVSNRTRIQPDPTRSNFIWTDLEIDFAQDLPARPGTWVCIKVTYSKDFTDYYNSADLSPVWSKVRADLIQRFGSPSKEQNNSEILFGDEDTRFLKASHPYCIELEDKELTKRLRDTLEQIRRDEKQRKALAQGEAVAETINFDY